MNKVIINEGDDLELALVQVKAYIEAAIKSVADKKVKAGKYGNTLANSCMIYQMIAMENNENIFKDDDHNNLMDVLNNLRSQIYEKMKKELGGGDSNINKDALETLENLKKEFNSSPVDCFGAFFDRAGEFGMVVCCQGKDRFRMVGLTEQFKYQLLKILENNSSRKMEDRSK